MSLATEPAPPSGIDAEDWPVWLAAILPGYFIDALAPHHVDFWRWVWSIEPGQRPDAFVGIWSRDHAKSTNAEAACVALGAKKVRRYGLYVCDTQDRADDHVGNVGSMLESEAVELFYPDMASRQVTKYGTSRGWRRNRLWTSAGFVIDAIGLDSAARGVKIEDRRPDFLVIDDIDGRHDTAEATLKKVETLTESVIPAGSDDLAILAIQNLVKARGVFDQLANGTAEYLKRRHVSGPIPAIEGLKVERRDGRDVIVAGTPTWPHRSLQVCQWKIDDMGLRAFRRECQHEVGEAEGALWCRDQIEACRLDEHPDLSELVVSVDPSGGKGKRHDDQGIVAVGKAGDAGYVLEDRTCSLSPMGWGKRAVLLAIEMWADRIICEDNYGGEMPADVVRLAADALAAEGVEHAQRYGSHANPDRVKQVNASWGSKEVRASAAAACYGEKERAETWPDRMYHVGDFPALEAEQTGWEPDKGGRSPNRVDALTHAVKDLGLIRERGQRRSRFRG